MMHSVTSRIGASPRWHGGIMTGQGCVLTSVCFWTAEKCWAKSSTVLLKRPAWEIGSSRKHTLSAFRISARFSQRCCSWTTRVDIAWPMAYGVSLAVREAGCRVQFLHQALLKTTLMQFFQCFGLV